MSTSRCPSSEQQGSRSTQEQYNQGDFAQMGIREGELVVCRNANVNAVYNAYKRPKLDGVAYV